MTDNINPEYQFKYITFKELENLEKYHPIVNKTLSWSSWEKLKTCPDITDDFPCFFYIKNKDDQIICRNKALPDILWVGNKKYNWAWTGDTFTEIAYRKKGLAEMLIQESTKILHQKGIGRGIVFSNNITLHIYKKSGYFLPGYASRFLMIKRAQPFLKAHIKSSLVVNILDLLSYPIIKFIYKYYYKQIKLNNNIKPNKIKLYDKNKSAKPLPKVYYQNKFHFNDSLEKLIWKIKVSNENVENNCSLYILKEIRSVDPIAYFVIRIKRQREPIGIKYKDFNIMTLMDYGLFKNDEKIFSMLLKKITNLFWKSDTQVLEIISNSQLFASTMRRMGMIRVGKGMSFAFSVPNNWDLGKNCYELHNWPLTHFCGDGFSF